jgi:hypothetical protein
VKHYAGRCGAGALLTCLARHFLKHPIDYADMEVNVFVQTGAKAVDEGDCADVRRRLVCARRARAVGLQRLRNDAQEDAQHHAQHRAIALHKVTQPLGHRQYPLAHRQAGEDVVGEVRRCLDHTPGIAGGAHTPAFAGEGHQEVVPAVATAGARKAVGEDAAFQVFGKRFAYEGPGAAVVALPVKLACAGQVKRSCFSP